MKYMYTLVALLVTVPLLAQEEKPIEVPTIAIKVPMKQALALDGVTLTFLEVVEDSRCPKNTTCVWEGRAIIKVALLTPDGETQIKELEFRNNSMPLIGAFNETALRAVQLSPYPDAEIPPAERAPYALLIKRE